MSKRRILCLFPVGFNWRNVRTHVYHGVVRYISFFLLFKVYMLYKQIIISSLDGNLNALNPQLIYL